MVSMAGSGLDETTASTSLKGHMHVSMVRCTKVMYVLQKISYKAAPCAYQRGLQIRNGNQLIDKVHQFDVVLLTEMQTIHLDVAVGRKDKYMYRYIVKYNKKIHNMYM